MASTSSSLPSTTHHYRSLWWDTKLHVLFMIDQRKLPTHFEICEYRSAQHIAQAIRDMVVRGAPAIGAAGAYALAIDARHYAAHNNNHNHHHETNQTNETLVERLRHTQQMVDAARPTAVNLMWATQRMMELAEKMHQKKMHDQRIAEVLMLEAEELANDDVRINKALAAYGADIVPHNANILHHCNTGKLATVDWGTALGVIYTAHEQRKNVHVWVDETRPRLQGAKLTAWELMKEGVPMHLIPDNASGLLMYSGRVDMLLFGADRVAANGDTANKIGTYKISVCARENGIPVYACVPTSTIDLAIASGKDIVIEERSAEEVTHLDGVRLAPIDCPVFNPAFDVTPHKYLTGIITEEGICYPPYSLSLAAAKHRAEQRIRDTWQQRLDGYLDQSH